MRPLLSLAAVASWILGCPRWCRAAEQDRIQFFETKIRPVLATNCFGCHSSQAPKLEAGLSLDSTSGIRKGGNSGSVIEPGQPDHSLLIRAIRYQEKSLKMPPGKPLAPDVVADFETWIHDGAHMPADAAPRTAGSWNFWSLRSPQDTPVPKVHHADEASNAIDYFILEKL